MSDREYAKELLMRIVEACEPRDLLLTLYPAVLNHYSYIEACGRGGGKSAEGYAPTLVEALAALLTDLGVEVPERPEASEGGYCPRTHECLLHLRRAIALLEGGTA